MRFGQIFVGVLACAPVLAGLSTTGCSTSSMEDQGGAGKKNASSAQSEQGRRLVRGMMGLPESPAKATSDAARVRVARYEALAKHILDTIEDDEPGALARFDCELASHEDARVQKAWPAMRDKLRVVAGKASFKEELRDDLRSPAPRFRASPEPA